MNIPAFNSGVAGIRAAEAQLESAANETYEATVPTDQITLTSGEGDLVHATTERIRGELAFRASLKTIQTADQMSNLLLELISRR